MANDDIYRDLRWPDPIHKLFLELRRAAVGKEFRRRDPSKSEARRMARRQWRQTILYERHNDPMARGLGSHAPA
jgi:hypothetical protein